MVVQGGGGVSYERGTPVGAPGGLAGREGAHRVHGSVCEEVVGQHPQVIRFVFIA